VSVLKIEFVNDLHTKLVLRLGSLPDRVREVIGVKLRAYLFLLAGKIQAEKLSGQLLNVRTGVLRASVHATPVTTTPTTISGEVQAAGGPAFYGVPLEKGGLRAYQIAAVKGRALKFLMNGKEVYAKSVMHPPQRAHWFMRSSAQQAEAGLRSGLAEGVKRTIEEK
jgi:hypothetical protein